MYISPLNLPGDNAYWGVEITTAKSKRLARVGSTGADGTWLDYETGGMGREDETQ